MPIALHSTITTITTTITTSLRVNFSPFADALGASEMLIKSALSHTQCVCGGGGACTNWLISQCMPFGLSSIMNIYYADSKGVMCTGTF